MAAPNFVLITELQTLHRRDFPLKSTDVANLVPTVSNPISDGEWLELDSATNYQLTRNAGAESTNMALWPVHTEKGRYDTQALGKVNVLMLGMYEAESVYADTTSLVVGSALTVQDVTVGGLSKRALKLKSGTAGSGVVVVGFVTKTYGTLGVGGKVRFVHFDNMKIF